MEVIVTQNWSDYELLDSGSEQRFERFGKYTIVRPDPQAIWQPRLPKKEWNNADAIFEKLTGDKGKWICKNPLPEKWCMRYKNLSFFVKLSPFKHTGVFPEQARQWDFIQSTIIKAQRPINVLNLFGYTGIATLAAAQAEAKVTHVDASKSSISWARQNQEASKLQDKSIRWILDDATKFVEREVKRGVKYDGIIMDPPVYGHGPNGELWKFSEHFPKLLYLCKQVLSKNPLFILINAYAISSSSIMLINVLNDYTYDLTGSITYGELALQQQGADRLLSTGIFARWCDSNKIHID